MRPGLTAGALGPSTVSLNTNKSSSSSTTQGRGAGARREEDSKLGRLRVSRTPHVTDRLSQSLVGSFKRALCKSRRCSSRWGSAGSAAALIRRTRCGTARDSLVRAPRCLARMRRARRSSSSFSSSFSSSCPTGAEKIVFPKCVFITAVPITKLFA